jgi:hypothetical protein
MTGQSRDAAMPGIAVGKAIFGSAGLLTLMSQKNTVISEDVRTALNSEWSHAMQQYTAGDRNGAAATIITAQQIADGTLAPANIDSKQAAKQNAIAQVALGANAAGVVAGKEDPNTFLAHAAVASYYAQTTNLNPGNSIINIEKSTAVLFTLPVIQATLNLALTSSDPDIRERAVRQGVETRQAAITAFSSALNAGNQNDTFKDNQSGAWSIRPNAGGTAYQAVFDRATYKAWASQNQSLLTTAGNASAGLGFIGPGVTSTAALANAFNESQESSKIPQSIQLKLAAVNRSLYVLENSQLAAMDPSIGGTFTPKQLADHYVKGVPLPGQEKTPSPSAIKAQDDLDAKFAANLKTADYSGEFNKEITNAETAAQAGQAYGKGEKLYGPLADESSKSKGINPLMFRQLIGSESSWDPNSDMSNVSQAQLEKVYAAQGIPYKGQKSHAAGLGMFVDETGRQYGLLTQADKKDPKKALPAAAAAFSDILKRVTPSGQEPDLEDYLTAVAQYKGQKHLSAKQSAPFEQAWKESQEAEYAQQ